MMPAPSRNRFASPPVPMAISAVLLTILSTGEVNTRIGLSFSTDPVSNMIWPAAPPLVGCEFTVMVWTGKEQLDPSVHDVELIVVAGEHEPPSIHVTPPTVTVWTDRLDVGIWNVWVEPLTTPSSTQAPLISITDRLPVVDDLSKPI